MTKGNFWPYDIQGAVSLTFDDGAITQIDNAVPCLDDHRLKGTFCINPGRLEVHGKNRIPFKAVVSHTVG